MSEQLSSVIEKVKKLLALTKSASAGEAANAARAANKLIDSYRLSEIDLAIDNTESDPMVEDDDYIYETGRIVPWKMSLVNVLTNHYGVANYNDNHFDTGRQVSRFKLVGRTSDIQIVRYMFSWLISECQRLADHQVKGQGRVVVASYCAGFVSGVAMQLQASRAEVKQTASASAIVKLDDRLNESKAFLFNQKTGLRMVKTKSHVRRDAGSFLAGQQQGKNIHLGAVMSASKTKLLG